MKIEQLAPVEQSTMTASTLPEPASRSPEPLVPWNDLVAIGAYMDRLGGISAGQFASMNLASWTGDDPRAVRENWNRWRANYPNLNPVYLNQTHGKMVHAVNRRIPLRLEGDGMVTEERGLALCIFTADCVPILMLDREREIVGALHAGWRGTLANIAAEGMRAMINLGAEPKRIEAALGPAIGACCFEVDRELADRFCADIPGSINHTRYGAPGKAYLDLRGILQDQLYGAGVAVENIKQVGPCTRCAGERFFSRRASGGHITGLQMSFISLRPEAAS